MHRVVAVHVVVWLATHPLVLSHFVSFLSYPQAIAAMSRDTSSSGNLDVGCRQRRQIVMPPRASLCVPLSSLQAIAAMSRAKDADPANLDALLALGVSHTNGTKLGGSLGEEGCSAVCRLQ